LVTAYDMGKAARRPEQSYHDSLSKAIAALGHACGKDPCLMPHGRRCCAKARFEL
jgi:hypothetical protein